MRRSLLVMTRDDDIALALDALSWQIELGADEAIGDEPVDRLSVAEPVPTVNASPTEKQAAPQEVKPSYVPESLSIAKAVDDLKSLELAVAEFDGCALKKGARNTVFADGNPAARVMIIGEAPGRDEDTAGKPFVGRSGKLLDKMFAGIGLTRVAEEPAKALYITNVLPWRPPQNRDPSSDEIALMLPFLYRHIELIAPDVIVTMGNSATKTLLETSTGITRMRGRWAEARGHAVLPMFHPAALLRNPIQKRDAWSDLLSLKARLEAT